MRERGGRGILLGGVLIPGATAPKLVTRAMVSRMKKGAVIVDVAIDPGRLRGNRASHFAFAAQLYGGRGGALLRDQYAGRGA